MRDVQMFRRGQIFWRKEPTDETKFGIIGKARPVLLVSNDVGLGYSPVATVVPLTTQARRNLLCTQVPIKLDGVDNYILCEQIYTCPSSELMTYVGTVNSIVMEKVDTALCYALGLLDLPTFTENKEVMEPEISVTDEEAFESMPAENCELETDNDNKSKGKWCDTTKLQLCIDYDGYKEGVMTESELMGIYPQYSNLQSLQATVRKFKKQLGV